MIYCGKIMINLWMNRKYKKGFNESGEVGRIKCFTI